MTLSIGIPGALSDETVRLVAPAVEAAGYRALWINDTPKGDALAKLAVAAEVLARAKGRMDMEFQQAQDIREGKKPLEILYGDSWVDTALKGKVKENR